MKNINMQSKAIAFLLAFMLSGSIANAAPDMKSVNEKVCTVFAHFFDYHNKLNDHENKLGKRSWNDHIAHFDALIAEIKALAAANKNDKKLVAIYENLTHIKNKAIEARKKVAVEHKTFGTVDCIAFGISVKSYFDHLHKALPHMKKDVEKKIEAKYGSLSLLNHFHGRINMA